MKRKFFTLVLLCLALQGMAQFIQQPLNYPGTGYWPNYISVADPQHVWIGTITEFGDPYSFAVKTADGGNSWTFDSIPVHGEPYCAAISSVDSNTCFYLYTDLDAGEGTIWKSTDGGDTWTNTITTQFMGGYANGVHAFTADTVVAMGDPTNGYFEIQVTNDGGTSWERVPSANIPDPLSGEMGMGNAYAAFGNSVWFTTNKGRCFRSADKGLHWDVSQVVTGSSDWYKVCFSSTQTGAFWKGDAIINEVSVTLDGGVTWNAAALPPGYSIAGMSPVSGFDEGFVLTGFQNFIDVFFTPDLFNTMITLASSVISIGSVAFLDPETGWLAGGESGVNEIYKWDGVLSAAGVANNVKEGLSILPNPSAAEALVKLPACIDSKKILLRITDVTGKVIDQFYFLSTGWTKLNAAAYENGMYLVDVLFDNKLVSREKWVVTH